MFEENLVVDTILNYYASILNIKVVCKTPKEKVLSIIYCNNVYIKRERLIWWFDPYFVYKDKISNTTKDIQARLRIRFAFKDYEGWSPPEGHPECSTPKKGNPWPIFG